MKTSKVKKISLIAVSILLILTSFTSCGKTKVNTLEGKWYNDEKRCLEINADGTYKLEDEYGTGTWKLIDENTIEFIDFYGEDKKADIIRNNNNICIDFKGKGIFIKDDVKETTENLSSSEYAIEDAYEFHDNVGWVKYRDENGDLFCAQIDQKGKIQYELNISQGNTYVHTADRICCIVNEIDKVYKYYLVNSKGKLIAESGENSFDAVVTCDKGMALVVKDASNISESSLQFGIMDENGDFIYNYTEFKGLKSYYQFSINIIEDVCSFDESYYAGSNIWCIKRTFSQFTDYLNFGTNKFYHDNYDSREKLTFENGTAFSLTGYYKNTIVKWNTDFSETIQGEIQNNMSLNNNKSIKRDVTKNKISVTDLITNKTITFNDHNSNSSHVEYYNGYYSVTLDGKDQKEYFTIVDSNGKELFEPTVYKYNLDFAFNDKVVVYENENGNYNINDFNGITLAQDLPYKYVAHFNNNLALAKDDDKNIFYINTKGEKAITNIYK